MDQLRSLGDAARRTVGGVASTVGSVGGAFGVGGGESYLLNVTKQVIDERDPRPLDKSLLTAVVSAIQSPNPEVQLQGLLAGVVASEDDTNKLTLVYVGALGPVISVVSESRDPKAIYAAARILWHLSKLEESRPLIVKSGGLEAAAKVANGDNSANQYAALRVILHICESSSFHKQVLSSQLPYTITKLLGSPSDQVAYVSASCVTALAETDPNHPAFIDDGFIGTLANVCIDGSENSKYAGFAAVRGLAKNDDTIKKLASSGVVDALIENMTSHNDRLQYIAMMTLSSIPAVASEKLNQMISPAIRNLSSSRASVVSAAARFIRAYATHEKLRTAIIKKNDYLPFINTLTSKDPLVGNAGAQALNAVLKDPEAAAGFVAQGGIASIAKMLSSGDKDQESSAIQLAWPLTFVEKHHASLLEQTSLAVLALANSHSNTVTNFLACMVVSALNVPESHAPVEAFLKSHPYKDTLLEYDFTPEDLLAIPTLFDSTHDEGQRLFTWVFAMLSVRNVTAFVHGKGTDALDHFACSGTPATVEMANSVLSSLDLTAGLAPEDASALLDFFLGDIRSEVETVETLKQRRNQLEKDLRVNYKKKQNMDKLPLFKPLVFATPAANAKLAEVAALRTKIDNINVDLVKEMEEMDPLLGSMQRDLDIFNSLFAKQEDQQKIKEIKQKIADISKEIAEAAKKLEAEEGMKNKYEGERRTLVAKYNQIPQLEKDRVNIVSELEDVQYQLDNYDSVLRDMSKDVADTASQRAELEKKLEELKQQLEEQLRAIQAAKDSVVDAEKALVDYQDLRNTIDRFKKLRKDVKDKYGEELNELTEFHALLGGLMNSGYTKLKALSGEETPRDSTSAFTREKAQSFLDFGSKAEVELNERVASLYSVLEDRLNGAKKHLLELEEQLNVLRSKIELTETEIARAIDKASIADMRKNQMPSKDMLDLKKRDLQDKIDKVDKEIGELSKLRAEIDAVNAKIEEQTKTIAHDNAHKRRLDADLHELERQLKQVYGTLDTDLNKFAESFTRFKKARSQFQAKLRPVVAQTAQWKKLFEQEKKLMTEAYTSLLSIVLDIQVVVDGLTHAKEEKLFVSE